MIAGVLLVQVTATLQTSTTVSGGMQNSFLADIYLWAIVAGTLASIGVGIGVLVLIARAPAAGAMIGESLATVALAPWLDSSVSATVGLNLDVLAVFRWVPAVIVGLTIAWSGVGTIGRFIAAIVGLFALWMGPALVAAVSSAACSHALAHEPAEMLDFGARVFTSALLQPALSTTLGMVAGLIAGVGLLLRFMLERLRRPSVMP